MKSKPYRYVRHNFFTSTCDENPTHFTTILTNRVYSMCVYESLPPYYSYDTNENIIYVHSNMSADIQLPTQYTARYRYIETIKYILCFLYIFSYGRWRRSMWTLSAFLTLCDGDPHRPLVDFFDKASNVGLGDVLCYLPKQGFEQTAEVLLIEYVLTLIWSDCNAYEISTRTAHLW